MDSRLGQLPKFLGVAKPNPQGVLILGASRLMRELAHALTKHNIQVLLLDTLIGEISPLRRQGGLKTHLWQRVVRARPIAGPGSRGYWLFAHGNTKRSKPTHWPPSTSANCSNVPKYFNCLPKKSSNVAEVPRHLKARIAFDPYGDVYGNLQERFDRGGKIKSTDLTARLYVRGFSWASQRNRAPAFCCFPNRCIDDCRGWPKP